MAKRINPSIDHSIAEKGSTMIAVKGKIPPLHAKGNQQIEIGDLTKRKEGILMEMAIFP